ncbi:heavy metal-associated isoprenylated plant protein 7 [Selaginella moellendorffii]|uniref:heavy metal-associated isoprenylated plant protein 7 n=1 Tax=Selaginella moellendorffii TaxID=88036 RepID=UPI000D1C2173|nr:heavy metal-associated isoprenylated plant protein 7 [Selaginella moellendorffii]|eukprot:XP_002991703.2 heavy metal-associated isoprenylated plant protein 7 [Selaginella moellendorffii]
MAELKTMTLKILTKSNRGRYKITNELCKVPGVKNIVVDLEEQKMTVTGHYEQENLLKKVAKFKKLVQVWPSDPPPPPPQPDNPMPSIIELKVALHCPGCQRRVLAALCELRGVEKVDTDMEKQRVVVTGHVDPDSLLRKIAKTKKRAQIASVTHPPPPEAS